MDLTRPSELKELLKTHGLTLTKRFGQHFLIDRNLLLKVVQTAAIEPTDKVFEIGPGVGTLTVELAERAVQVVAVELDASVLPILNIALQPFAHTTVVLSDVLKLDLPAFLAAQWGSGETGKVVANIPYNITSPILIKLLESKHLFRSITLMVQKEVAERLRAKPGTEEYGALSVFVQFHAAVTLVGIVPKGVFFPPPKVDSAIIHLVPHAIPPVTIPSEEAFFAVSRAVFGQRRKTLLNALANAATLTSTKEAIGEALAQLGIDAQRRGETLSLEEIAAISRVLIPAPAPENLQT